MSGFLRLIGKISRGEDVAVHNRNGRRTLGGRPVRHIGLVHRSATPSVGGASVTFTDNSIDATDLTIYTFSAQALGSASSKKTVVGVSGARAAAGDHTVSGVTVAGSSATLVKRQSVPTATRETVELWEVNGITATSGDVVVTWSAGMTCCGIGVYEVLNAGTSAYATAGSNADPMSVSIETPSGGVMIGVGKNAGSGTFTWTNATEQYDEAMDAANEHTGALSTTAGTVTVTCDPSAAGSDNAMALASWASA